MHDLTTDFQKLIEDQVIKFLKITQSNASDSSVAGPAKLNIMFLFFLFIFIKNDLVL